MNGATSQPSGSHTATSRGGGATTPGGKAAAAAEDGDPDYGRDDSGKAKVQKEMTLVSGPRWKLMQSLVMHSGKACAHDWRCKWSRNSRKVRQHTYDAGTSMTIFTDFAAQSVLHAQDAQCCGTDAHCNKDIFVTQRDARDVEVDAKSGTKKRVHTTDVWTVFFPASAKYKDNDYLAHWKSLKHIVDHYVALRKKRASRRWRGFLFTLMDVLDNVSITASTSTTCLRTTFFQVLTLNAPLTCLQTLAGRTTVWSPNFRRSMAASI